MGQATDKAAEDSTTFGKWFLEGMTGHTQKPARPQHQSQWWQVMCLTGVDYFSSLAYQCGIAFLAAGALSPIATLILVAVTLFGAVPVYTRVARESHEGQGSVAMLEKRMPSWSGKLFVLILLGFAATDFIITITLSAADASAHLVANPLTPAFLHSQMGVTMAMLGLLGAIFLIGFREAIEVAVALVSAYLALNLVTVGISLAELVQSPQLFSHWSAGLTQSHGSPLAMIGFSILVFPKLALGLSGFETGVAVMPYVRGLPDDQSDHPVGRIKHTRFLLVTAAMIMSFLLVTGSLTTSLLIPEAEFQPGGAANGRALAYLAHRYLGQGFGTVYDLSSIAILWFAGASAMAGLLSLVPRYLPRYGMAPNWTTATRPLVVFFTAVAVAVTYVFNADVDAQGGAYATGVLFLITSASVAVTMTVWGEGAVKRLYFLSVSSIFIYTTIANCLERPDGLHIAMMFIAAILAVSLISRALRSTELRMETVTIDETAEAILSGFPAESVRLVAHKPGDRALEDLEREMREIHSLQDELLIFLEVTLGDASEFEDQVLDVRGAIVGDRRVLRCCSPAVPNAIAALLLYVRDKTGRQPHVYMSWTEGNPLAYIVRYLVLGEGETAAINREVLRKAEPDLSRRPMVHVA